MNAMVSVSLSELDALRSSAKTWEEKATSLEKTEKQIKLVLTKKEIMYGESTSRGYYDGYNAWARSNRVSEIVQKENLVIVSSTYENMSEIQDALREEARSAVGAEISMLKSAISQAARDLKEEKERTREEHKQTLEKIEDTLKQKDKEIALLKGEKIEKNTKEEYDSLMKQYQTLEEKYNNLQSELLLYKTKNWFQRLFKL